MIKKSTFIIALTIFMLNVVSLAANDESVSVTVDKNTVIVNLEHGPEYESVGVYILKGDVGDYKYDTELSPALLENCMIDYGVIGIGESTAIFEMHETSQYGKYVVYANSLEYSEAVLQEFDYVNYAQVQALIESINDADTKEAVLSVLNSSSTLLEYFSKDAEKIENMGTKAKLMLAEAVFNGGTDYDGDNKTELFSNNIKKGVLAAELKSGDDFYSEVKNIIDITGFAYKQAFGELSPNGISNFNRSFESYIPYEDYASFEMTILKSFVTADVMSSGYTSVYDKLNDYAEALPDILNIDFSNYNSSYTDKEMTLKAFLEKSVTKAETIKEAFQSSITTKKSSSGGGSGGSSGGSGSFMVQSSAPVVSGNALSEEAETEKEDEIFSDLDKCQWAKSAIMALYNKKIINGKSEKIFDPDNYVKREEFVKMLVRCLNIKSEGDEYEFLDVSRDDYFKQYIDIAVKNGISIGVGDDKWGKGDNIKRQDMAVMCKRALDSIGCQLPFYEEKPFSDSNVISDYAYDSVSKMAAANIIKGTEDGFQPFLPATRVQAAYLIYQIMQVVE